MADQIKIQQSAAPWLPTDDAQITETFLHYDFPRAGIVQQEGNAYLFSCLDEFHTYSLWAYVLIEEGDEAALRESPARAIDYFENATKPISLSLASNGEIILSAAYRETGQHFVKDALECVGEVLTELSERGQFQVPA